MLILSDRIQANQWSGDSSAWNTARPSAEGYDRVVLDLYFGPPTHHGYCELSKDDAHFYELGLEVAKSLRAGGIVIALLGPVAVTTRNLRPTYGDELFKLKNDNLNRYDSKYVGSNETSYDWLDQGFLAETKIDSKFAGPTEGITAASPRPEMSRYAYSASKYWVSIAGIECFGGAKTEGTVTHRVAQAHRWNCGTVQQYSATILAIGKHTKLPVAAAMRYMDWNGVLILLPPFELKYSGQPGAKEEVTRLCSTLKTLGEGIREDFLRYEAAEHEAWVWEHRAPPAKQIVSEIEQARQKEKDLEQQLGPYEQMLVLLDGTGAPLVGSVATLFDKPGEGIRVEPTGKGAPIDLFVSDSINRRLAIEVTGIKGTLRKDDPHWADFLGYIPEHNARNEHGRVERIVLVVNTECKTELEKRNRTNDITPPVKKTVTDNKICVLRSCDLYQLWLKTLEGLPTQKVFDTLFNCEGIFTP